MKYFRILICVFVTIFIMFSFSACDNKENEDIILSYSENSDEVINNIISENNKLLKNSKNKYKQKLISNNSEKTPSAEDYDFSYVKEVSNDLDESTIEDDLEHNYVCGICTNCGKADNSKPNLALATLLKRDGTYNKSEITYSKNDKVSKNLYSIIYDGTSKTSYLKNTVYNGKSVDYTIYLDIPNDKKNLVIRYEKVEDNGSITPYTCVINANNYIVNTTIVFNDYNGSEKQKNEIESISKNSANVLMKYLNSYLNSTESGLILKDFGFYSYIPIGSK